MVSEIRRLCKEKQITVSDLERLAGLTPNTVYRWDKHSPSIRKVAKVARALDVSMDELIGHR